MRSRRYTRGADDSPSVPGALELSKARNDDVPEWNSIWNVLLILFFAGGSWILYLRVTSERGSLDVRSKPAPLLRPSYEESFDVVYTWVNGSEPDFQAAVRQYSNNSAFQARRFTDHDELKYSLRSLEMYAPWVGQVYLVTNGQVPFWLNTEKVKVVTHEEIYERKEHLPTFSSPSIEANIHRIPGLSKRFIYFNDDMFLGAPVHPEDFILPSGIQRVYLTWELPDCAPGCAETFINDKFCDAACNVSSCDFDGGDCQKSAQVMKPMSESEIAVNEKGDGDRDGEFDSEFIPLMFNPAEDEEEFMTRKAALEHDFCSQGCAVSWLGDGICDASCRNEACGFDAGDCPKNPKGSLTSYTLRSLDEPLRIARPVDRNPPWWAFTVTLDHSLADFGQGKVIRLENNRTDFVRSMIFVPKWSATLVIVALKALDAEAANSTRIGGRTNLEKVVGCSLKIEFASTVKAKRIAGANSTISRSKRITGGVKPNMRVLNFSFVLTKTYSSESVSPRPDVDDGDVHDDDVEEYASKIMSHHEDEDYGDSYVPSRRKKEANAVARKEHERRLADAYGDEDENENNQVGHDAFGKSLVHTKRMLKRLFPRKYDLLNKVPAHMPHLIDRDVLSRLRGKFKSEFALTSAHKFRSDDDMQFMYAYFAYLLAESDLSLTNSIVWSFIDTDGDGCLDTNEFRTLATFILRQDSFYAMELEDYAKSGQGTMQDDEQEEEEDDEEDLDGEALPKIDDKLLSQVRDAIWEEARESSPIPVVDSCLTFRVLKRANRAYEAVVRNVQEMFKRTRPVFEIVDSTAHASFAMLKDKPSEVLRTLDALRARPTKFVCINDDTTANQSEKHAYMVGAALKQFFESWFPRRSSYELSKDSASARRVPENVINTHLPIREEAEWTRFALIFGCCSACILTLIAWWIVSRGALQRFRLSSKPHGL